MVDIAYFDFYNLFEIRVSHKIGLTLLSNMLFWWVFSGKYTVFFYPRIEVIDNSRRYTRGYALSSPNSPDLVDKINDFRS